MKLSKRDLGRWALVLVALVGGFIVLNGNSKASKQKYIRQIHAITEKWDDAFNVASSSSRIALSQPVARLQEIKGAAKILKISAEMQDCHQHLLGYMDGTIEGFLSFMQNSDSKYDFSSAQKEKENWMLCIIPEDEANELKRAKSETLRSLVDMTNTVNRIIITSIAPGKTFTAIIRGKGYKEGDEVEGYKIHEISYYYVEFSDKYGNVIKSYVR